MTLELFGPALLAPFTLTNGQSLTFGGVRLAACGNGIIRVASPALTLVNPVRTGTNISFWFQTRSNALYTVEFNDDLRTTNWRFHHTITGDSSLMPSVIPITNTPQRYFRVLQP